MPRRPAWLKSSLWLVVDCNNNSNVNSQKQDSGRLLSFQTIFVFTKLPGIFYLSFYGITLLSYGMFVYFWKLRELFILLPWNNTVILFIQKQNPSCSSNKWINFYCACPTDNVISNQLACATELIHLIETTKLSFTREGK